MKTLQSYLAQIRDNPKTGWAAVYRDLLNSTLTDDNQSFFKGVEMYGEAIIFEAVLVTASKDNLGYATDKTNYLLAVARKLWQEELKRAINDERAEIRVERVKRTVEADNASLAERIEQAKRRVNESDTL